MNSGSTDKASQPVTRAIRSLEDFTEQAINEWIGHLPLSDVDGACEAIHNLLRAVNMRDGLACLERQRIVEQIRPPAVSLLSMSSERHVPPTALFPLPPATHRHTQRSVEVCLELANAYRRIVTSGTFFSDKYLNGSMRAQNIYRAMQAYGLALLRSLERYESPPEGFWREVFSFYRFAEGHRLHNLNLPMPEIEGATVDSQFKQMLLLALSSHQHHTPDTIRQFYTALMLIAKDVEIRSVPELDNESALFYFDIGSDNSPRPTKRAKKLARGSERRYLYTRTMLVNAQRYFSNPSHRASERFKLRVEVIMALLDTLADSDKRRFVRKSASGKRHFSVGLARLIDELAGAGPQRLAEMNESTSSQPEAMADEDADDVEIVLDQSGRAVRTEIWAKPNDSGYMNKSAAEESAKLDEARATAESASSELTGSLLNMSAGGYCMAWRNPMVAGARVGELIGIYEDNQRIHVGVIRWLHHKAKGELVIGIELLSPAVEAVSIETGRGANNLQRGLYLSANQRLGHPASLLSGPGLFKAGETIVLRSNDGRLLFRLENLLSSTLSFQLFSLALPADFPPPDFAQPA
jgi:hypothetical protein